MKSTLDFLYSLHTFGMKFGLSNIRILLQSIDNPHKKFPSIHVAGTNGKGSTSSMIAAIFTAAGYNVGLYTSPHLVRFNERIRINGKMISDKDVMKYTKLLRSEIIRTKSTFFEATTAVAFKYFADQKVDIAVIETGLGGRLDSTNVITPIVSVITTIGKDHTEQLGTTLRQIAFEKAGIIKRSVPVVIGRIHGIAKKVIVDSAKMKKAPLIQTSAIHLPRNIEIELKGKHQRVNASTAYAAVALAASHFLIGDSAVRQGFQNTVKLSGLRGRLEIIKGRPDILLDVAHNPEGISSLVPAVKGLGEKETVILFAVMKDKDYRQMLRRLRKISQRIVLAPLNMERSLPVSELSALCKQLEFKVYEEPSVKSALMKAKKIIKKDAVVIVTGSNYLVGEVLSLLTHGK